MFQTFLYLSGSLTRYGASVAGEELVRVPHLHFPGIHWHNLSLVIREFQTLLRYCVPA